MQKSFGLSTANLECLLLGGDDVCAGEMDGREITNSIVWARHSSASLRMCSLPSMAKNEGLGKVHVVAQV